MSVTIYRAPDEVGQPPPIGGLSDWKEYEREAESWIQSVQDWARRHGRGRVKGEIYHYPVADGYAQYVVLTSTKLIHLDVYDAWQIDAITQRGLRGKDIIAAVDGDRRLAEAFSR